MYCPKHHVVHRTAVPHTRHCRACNHRYLKNQCHNFNWTILLRDPQPPTIITWPGYQKMIEEKKRAYTVLYERNLPIPSDLKAEVEGYYEVTGN